MTRADLRTLLTRAHGPAVERLTESDPGAPARAYLPRVIWAYHRQIGTLTTVPIYEVMWGGGDGAEGTLDLTDPGTVNAVKVALALALGLDPGAMGCAVSWVLSGWPNCGTHWWHLTGVRDHRSLRSFERCRAARVKSDPRWDIDAPEVAAEADPIKALVLACQLVFKGKA